MCALVVAVFSPLSLLHRFFSLYVCLYILLHQFLYFAPFVSLESCLCHRYQVHVLACRGIALHCSGDCASSAAEVVLHASTFLVRLLKHAVCDRRARAGGNVLLLGHAAEGVKRVNLGSVSHAAYEKLDVERVELVILEQVGKEGGASLHAHRLSVLQLVKLRF